MKWWDRLRGDPLPWLLEPENPSVRYWTLLELKNRPANDPEVRSAQAAIRTYPPVVELLAAQKRDGYWVKRDFYLPKHYGTFWVLSVLADLGMTQGEAQIERACEFMFTFQREHGGFCRRRRIQGQGIVWRDQPGPCTHARIVRFLIQFGYGDDARVRAGVDWLLSIQREDGMWHCRPADRYGCLRATLDVLRVATLDPEPAAHPSTGHAVEAVCGLLMEPRMSRYHVGGSWTTLGYPYFGFSIISTLDALARLGCNRAHPKITAAADYLLSRQAPDGSWPLDQSPRRPPFDAGRPGEPNKWLTLDALRAIRLLDEAD